MPLFLGCLALFAPRLIIILVVLFSDYIGNAYQTLLWPLLGFIFLPLTTLGYAFAWHTGGGSVQGFGLVVVVVAVLLDLGLIGGGSSVGRKRRRID